MKKTCFLGILLVLLSPLFIKAQDQEESPQAQKARVIVDKAPIYLESNPYSFIIDTIGRGTVVTLFQTGKNNEKWLYISYYSKKRMAQVTGFIDSNLVEIVSEKPAKPERTLRPEAESITEEKIETEEERTEAEKKSSDIQKETAALENKLQEIEKESVETAGIKKESVEKEQQAEIAAERETAEEVDVKTEEKGKTQEEIKPEKKSMEAVKNLETQDKEMREQTEGETENQETESPEVRNEQPIEENFREVLTKITIKVRKANIRLMPSLESAVIHQLPFGVELEPLAKSGEWYRVNLPPNTEGFILSGYIHDSIVNETFEKQLLAPPEPEESLENEPEILGEESELPPEPSREIQPASRRDKKIPSVWIGGGAGYAIPSESHFDKGINFGGTFGFGITRYLALELRVPYYKSNVTGTAGGLSAGQFQAVSLTLSVQARYPIKNLIIPYLVGGGDYHLNKFTLAEEIVNSWNSLGFDIEENVEHSFGFHFGAGIDAFIMRSLALNFDVRYYTASMKGDWRLADTLSQIESSGPFDSIKLNSIQAGLSVKFFFNR